MFLCNFSDQWTGLGASQILCGGLGRCLRCDQSRPWFGAQVSRFRLRNSRLASCFYWCHFDLGSGSGCRRNCRLSFLNWCRSSWFSLLSWSSRSRWRSSIAVQNSYDGIYFDSITFVKPNFSKRAGSWRRNFGVNFVSRNLKEWLIPFDSLSNLLQPLRNCSFGDGFAHLWHHHFCTHDLVPSVAISFSQNCYFRRSIGRELTSSFDNVFNLRKIVIFERGRIGYWRVDGSFTDNRSIE